MFEILALTVALQQQSSQSVTVVSGNTLSSIAEAHHASWQALCADNKVSDCNLIYVGQRIAIHGGKSPSAHAVAYADDHTPAPAAPPSPSYVPAAPAPAAQTTNVVAAPDPAPQQAPITQQASAPRQAPAVSYSGSGGFQSCVIRRESGGNARAVNSSSGAGGLYQFLPSTWAGLGYSGLPENASVATQNAAFAKAYALDGTQPWAPSDGC